MDRAYLALVTKRLKEYERAQLDKVTAEAADIPNAHAGAVADGRAALMKALHVWTLALGRQLRLYDRIEPAGNGD